jgi:hypothetical protein
MGLRAATEAVTKHGASSSRQVDCSCFEGATVESTFELMNYLFAGTISTALVVVLIKSNLSEAVTATNDWRFASKHCHLHRTAVIERGVIFALYVRTFCIGSIDRSVVETSRAFRILTSLSSAGVLQDCAFPFHIPFCLVESSFPYLDPLCCY